MIKSAMILKNEMILTFFLSFFFFCNNYLVRGVEYRLCCKNLSLVVVAFTIHTYTEKHMLVFCFISSLSLLLPISPSLSHSPHKTISGCKPKKLLLNSHHIFVIWKVLTYNNGILTFHSHLPKLPCMHQKIQI